MKRIFFPHIVTLCSAMVFHLSAATTHCDCDFNIDASEEAISLLDGTDVIWTYNHRSEEGKPYFHPLATTSGHVFSDLRPDDHPWHRGMWFSWKFINGVNYWEEDRTNGLSEGKTRLISVDRTVEDSQDVRVEVNLEYAPDVDADAVMTEVRHLLVTAPDHAGVYSIEWSSRFMAVEETITLDRTPTMGQPEGKKWGGYAGWSLRMNQVSMGGTFQNSENQIDLDAASQPARWMSYTLKSGDAVLFLESSENYNYPAKWYVTPGMPYFSPAVIYDGPLTLGAGTSLELHYKMIVSPHPIKRDTADRLWREWDEAVR